MTRKPFALFAASLLLAACSSNGNDDGGGGGGGGTGTLALSMTDAAFVYDIVTEASITVDRVTVAPGADDESGFITVFEGTPMTIDLFHLRDGLTVEIGQTQLPAGSYRQVRLHVIAARLVLTNGNVYTTDDDTIHLTSQDTSGFKVVIDPPVQIVDGQTTQVLLDVDLTQTFHPVPANDPLNATSYSMHPVIHVMNLGETGGIQGTVVRDDGTGGTTPVANATVYVFHPGQTDPAQSVAATATNALGEFSVLAVEPDTYDVTAVEGVDTVTVPGVVVVVGTATTVDLTLPGTAGAEALRTTSRVVRPQRP